MGVKSTFSIDRETALDVIINKVHRCTNDQLANILLEFDESERRNYAVYNELPELENWEKKIESIEEFNK